MVDSTTSKRVTRGLSATMEAERRTKIRNYSMKQGCSYRVSFLMHMHGVDPIDILLQVMVSSTRINEYSLNLQLHMILYTLVLTLINAHCVFDASVHWKLLFIYFLKNTSHTYCLVIAAYSKIHCNVFGLILLPWCCDYCPLMFSLETTISTWRYLNSVKDNNHQRELYTFITTHRKHWLQKPNIAVGLSIWMLSLGLATAWCSNSTILAHHVTQQSSILKQPALFSNQLYLHRQLKQLLLRRLTTLVSL
ncbi:uncharacterized protein [Nicotiana tomentosiformis]|uniref:uncharacterized protein n=1 Tax=Nicotiana tomentosiformis TaxID=4098 RepID=UPI00051BD871|nr:uncharacterized protein LOC104098079 isoform X1 [Nicotiana tomentosiformis]XP_009603029.1 uncharacterized protein LOC104098079 isoform X1 [Nicotiana tomentosiformis]XP_009603031.1 uncharacterized protein LOC104098079 isoform X1 [Nicotiana tomentosiformis]XP_018626948.1 uncharacterized protein LOC104098079 isoform X1 [Nicotiana tomentosiformis]